MYVNRAGNEITDAKYNDLSPKMKVKYSKVTKADSKKEDAPKESKKNK